MVRASDLQTNHKRSWYPRGPVVGLRKTLAVRANASLLSAERPQWPRLVNVGLLIGGYGLGQGAIFAVQTWLVARGEYDLLSAFGTYFSFAMLSIFLIDAGSTTTLARQIAGLSTEPAGNEFWALFWATAVVRAAIAVVIGVAAAVYALAISSDPFSRCYLLTILPGLAVWIGNAVGLLDGLKLSGLSGIMGSLAFASSALGLALVPHAPPGTAGAILGTAFSVGYVLTVAAQWTALSGFGRHPRFQRPTRQGIIRALRDGLALLFQLVPGQLILRVQLVLSTVYLGTESTALFVYTKQVVVAMTMLVGFIMRVDFPGLVQKMTRSQERGIGSIFEAQKFAIGSGFVLTAGTLVVCLMAPLAPQYHLARAARLLMVYAPSIITISAVSIMMQGTAAIGDYVSGARIIAVSAVVGMVVSYLAIGPFEIYGLLIGEITFHLLGLGLLFRHLRRLR
jgi:O-antigen/teichoic acid export membrane protein